MPVHVHVHLGARAGLCTKFSETAPLPEPYSRPPEDVHQRTLCHLTNSDLGKFHPSS